MPSASTLRTRPACPATAGGAKCGRSVTGRSATVVEDDDPAQQVFVALYDISQPDEDALDSWEGGDLGLYTKIRVRVATLEGDVTAWLYVLDDYEGGLPSARYLGIIADAAEAAGAPDDYVVALRDRPCRSIG